MFSYRGVNTPSVLALGDSISYGYGHMFEDIWWVQLWRKQNLIGESLQVVSLAEYGNNLQDAKELLEKTIAAEKPIRMVIYQFNQNDIMPQGRTHLAGIKRKSIFLTLAAWRYNYANYSAFARFVQHHGGMLIRKRSGTPEDRGLDTLGPYTWTYGSRPFIADAEQFWQKFEEDLGGIQEMLDAHQIPFVVWISPTV